MTRPGRPRGDELGVPGGDGAAALVSLKNGPELKANLHSRMYVLMLACSTMFYYVAPCFTMFYQFFVDGFFDDSSRAVGRLHGLPIGLRPRFG